MLEVNFFHTPFLSWTRLLWIFGGNEINSAGITAVTITREIQGLSTVRHQEELLSSIGKYL